jgi:Lytic transglycolase
MTAAWAGPRLGRAAGEEKVGEGLAGWTGQGKVTASGEAFNPDGLTAGHRSVPFGTRVRVVNQGNGRSVVVHINDRGPVRSKFTIVLSRGSARQLGITGVARVKLYKVSDKGPSAAETHRLASTHKKMPSGRQTDRQLADFKAADEKAASLYEHNGSVIGWSVLPSGEITATYDRPRPGLRGAGVQEGTVLFKGYDKDGRIVGIAYAFKQGCTPAPYDVTGHEKGERIVLRGAGPVWAPAGCRLVGYSIDSPHAELVFNRDRGAARHIHAEGIPDR